jgi:nucleoside-diphosphate-sugar epimerase
VLGVDNFSRGSRINVLESGVDCTDADLRDSQDVDAALATFQPEIVIHLAAYVGGVQAVFANELRVFQDNSAIDRNVVSACGRYTSVKKLVYVSTAWYVDDSSALFDWSAVIIYVGVSTCTSVYPELLQDSYDVKKRGVVEDDSFKGAPESAYGLAKLFGEELAKLAASTSPSPFSCTIVRFHNVYGPRMSFGADAQVIPALMLKALRLTDGDELRVLGTGRQYRDFLHVSDAVGGLLKVIRPPLTPPSLCSSAAGVPRPSTT